MIVKIRIFKLCNGNYKNLSELAHIMEISVSQIYRVREGKRSINQKFIVGAMRAFPGYKFDDLFYFSPQPLNTTSNYLTDSEDELATKEKQGREEIQQALEEFASATKQYAHHL